MTDPYDPIRPTEPRPPVDPYADPPVSGTPTPVWYPPISGGPPGGVPVPHPPAAAHAQTGYLATSSYLVTSPRSKIVAGILQLVPGLLFALGGVGRLYAGYTMLGVIQLAGTLLGWISFWCGFALLFPFLITAAMWFWFVIDGIVLMAGRPVDGRGRPMRA